MCSFAKAFNAELILVRLRIPQPLSQTQHKFIKLKQYVLNSVIPQVHYVFLEQYSMPDVFKCVSVHANEPDPFLYSCLLSLLKAQPYNTPLRSTASEYLIHVCEHWVVIAVIPASWTLIADHKWRFPILDVHLVMNYQ